MKSTSFATAAFLLGLFSPLSAQAEDRAIGEGTLPQFLQQFDTNEDGRIDEEERQAIRDLRTQMREERRNSIDRDGDGQISAEEIEAARAALREQIEARRMEKFTEIAGEDGLISPEEYSQIPGMNRLPDFIFDAIFDRLDADDSGDITLEEFFQRLRRHRTERSSISQEEVAESADRR